MRYRDESQPQHVKRARFLIHLGAALTLTAAAAPASAHPGHGEQLGLIGGLLHPFTGIDHLVAMVMVGVWAFRLPIAGRWRAPLAFVGAMIAGFVAARAGLSLPAEPLIFLSLLALPVLVAMVQRLPLSLQFATVFLFGTAHGFAHGAEIEGPAEAFFLGMIGATLALHAIGYVGAELLMRRPQLTRR